MQIGRNPLTGPIVTHAGVFQTLTRTPSLHPRIAPTRLAPPTDARLLLALIRPSSRCELSRPCPLALGLSRDSSLDERTLKLRLPDQATIHFALSSLGTLLDGDLVCLTS